MPQRIPGHMFFCETERLEGNVDRAEELVFLDTVVTPNGHLEIEKTLTVVTNIP